jgi:hypothetical protein
MLRSSTSRLSRLLLIGVAAVALLAAVGCASSDDSSAPPPATTAAPQPAAPAGADRLDAGTLRNVRQTVARYCAGHGATAGELTGAIATLESLYEIDPGASEADGTTVAQAATALERKLRACGARTAAKRLARLTR